MKKLLVVAAIATAASPAFASKARVEALGNSPQLTDVQYVFQAPYQMHAVGELATIEWGGNGTDTPHAEGGFIKKHGDAFYGVYFGRQSEDVNSGVNRVNTAASLTGTNALLLEQNPLNLMYSAKMGDITWGATVKYSKGFDEVSASQKRKSDSTGIALGATNGTWEVHLVQGLGAQSDNGAGVKLKSKSNTKVALAYNLSDSMYAFGSYKMAESETTVAASKSTTKSNELVVGLVNTLVKADGVNFFYGVSYNSSENKPSTLSAGNPKTNETSLPVWLGVEADANSWMVLRAVVQQTVLINEEKTNTGSATTKDDVDNTTMAAGAGFKLGKGMLDATFGTASEGHLSFSDGTTDEFLSSVSYTYMF
ncbi:MAG: hypothetical protein LW875_11190 [Proteobacteria bacterium]|jgi:hypothetical protein|nr:hypothetical protein [Pseudomonadota bacterium]